MLNNIVIKLNNILNKSDFNLNKNKMFKHFNNKFNKYNKILIILYKINWISNINIIIYNKKLINLFNKLKILSLII